MGKPNNEVLLQEITDELKKQSDLKKDILTELKPTSSFQSFLEASKHPVILIILGSVLGAWLSSCYQKREWNRQNAVLTAQQLYARQQEKEELSRKQKIAQMIAIRDEALESIIDAHSAAQSAVRPLLYEDAATYMAKEKDRAKEWEKANETWQVARFKLTQKIEMAFSEGAQQKVKEIAEAKTPKDNFIFIDVSNLLAEARKKPVMLNETRNPFKEQSKEYRDYKEAIRANVLMPIVDVKAKTKELMIILKKEIENAN
jgi:hypothetical protein